ncbi:MAG TPA: tetratricopeptide repeat protein [Chloroflexota bacterium]|nr:tetratricopeptide repeat protein [Chloroflexota bacterium]
METTYSFGYWVKRRRKALDLTQQAVADCVGCATVTIKKIEADERRPSPTIAARLADCMALESAERTRFLAMAVGEQPGDTLALTRAPISNIPDHIPQAVNPFLGRETELTMLLAMVNQPVIRLISLIGPGGMGKTRLALATAAALARQTPRPFADGIVFVDLSAVNEPESLIPTLARSLHFPLTTSPQETRSHHEQLLDFLTHKEALLVLDNFEQILPAAPVLDSILAAAPRLKLLVTSRERLGLYGEHVYALPAMGFPTREQNAPIAAGYDAVQLFVAAAQRIRPSFKLTETNATAVVEICRLVGGLPLALELAAGWMDTLPPAVIAAESQGGLEILQSHLQNLAERHHSMRLILAAGWARLTAQEQAVFARLCLFQGGFTRQSATAVAGVSLAQLALFVGKSFVAADLDGERYHIHELLRQFGQEQLRATGDLAAAQQASFAYFQTWAVSANAHLRRAGQEVWLNRLDQEMDNLEQAMHWAMQQPNMVNEVARLVLALCWYWRIRSRPLVAAEWLAQVLAMGGLDTAVQADCLYHAGQMAWMLGDFEAAESHLNASLSLWTAAADERTVSIAYTRHALGMVFYACGQHAAAQACFHESLTLFTNSGDDWGEAFALGWLGENALNADDPLIAADYLTRSLELFQPMGDDWARGLFLGSLAWTELRNGRVAEAKALAEEAQKLEPALTHWHSAGDRLQLLAQIALKQGDMPLARRYYQAAFTLYTDFGNRRLAQHIQQKLDELF